MNSVTAFDMEQLQPRPRRKLLSLAGRIGRAHYIVCTLGGVLAMFLLMLLAGMALLLAGSFGHMLYKIFMVAMLYVFLPVFFTILTVRRAHDFNTGGWIALLLLVPLVNLVFWFIPGTRGDNAHGPQPDAPSRGARVAAVALPLLLIGAFLVADDDIRQPGTSDAPPASTSLRPYTP